MGVVAEGPVKGVNLTVFQLAMPTDPDTTLAVDTLELSESFTETWHSTTVDYLSQKGEWGRAYI